MQKELHSHAKKKELNTPRKINKQTKQNKTKKTTKN